MTMQAWRRLYELWRQYGLSKAAFYQFIDGEMPSLWCMYDRFHRIQLEIEAEPSCRPSRRRFRTLDRER